MRITFVIFGLIVTFLNINYNLQIYLKERLDPVKLRRYSPRTSVWNLRAGPGWESSATESARPE